MACVAMRLECLGLETLALDTPDVGAASIDFGDALTREVTQEAADSNGTVDTTSLIGSRVITVQILLDATGSALTRFGLTARLRAFTEASRRPSLYVRPSAADPELLIGLRRGPFSDVWVPASQERAKVTVQWVAPLGILESAVLYTTAVTAAASGNIPGRGYDLTFDRLYPSAPVIGTAPVTNNGNTDAYPILRIFGPCTNPVVMNLTQGRSMYFTGLTILANEYLEVNTRTKTVRYNGLASDSRYSTIVFPTSAWLSLSPGVNTIRYLPATSSPPSQVQIEYRDAYL